MLFNYLLSVCLFAIAFAGEIEVSGPLTPHFQEFLHSNGKSEYILDVVKNFGSTGSFGGRLYEGQKIEHTPVIFIHGNSDSALDVGTTEQYTGWTRQIAYFLERGYSTAELYAITYGDRNATNSLNRELSCNIMLGHRRLLEAVFEYTKAPKISIVSHSMGVTLARVIIHGGELNLHGQVCDLGESLHHRIDTLVSIASANHGMCVCNKLSFATACNTDTGFFPGVCGSNDEQHDCEVAQSPCKKFAAPLSTLLETINRHPKDAEFVFSLWSTGDAILGLGKNAAWGRQTSLVPHSDQVFSFEGLSHFEAKTETVKEQYHLIRYKSVPRDYFLR